jgi:hypothetical protein
MQGRILRRVRSPPATQQWKRRLSVDAAVTLAARWPLDWIAPQREVPAGTSIA